MLTTLFAEYRQKPLLNIGFIISLAIATTTLLSILLLNDNSKQQYQKANQQLKLPISYYIVANNLATIKREDFQALRASGFHQITAINRFQEKLDNGKVITIRAFDLLPLILMQPNKYGTDSLTLSSRYAASLGIDEQATWLFLNGKKVNVNIITDTQWSSEAVLDIAFAWKHFPNYNGFSHLVVGNLSSSEQALLQRKLPDYLTAQEAWSIEERQGFADALHLNLSALAILAFIVSLFIAYQAANQTWRSKQHLVIQLRQLGVTLHSIVKLFMFEALIISLLSCLLGIVLSHFLVNLLLPVLGLTLEQLYQLNVEQKLAWQGKYVLWAFWLSSFAVFVALFKQFYSIYKSDITINAVQQVDKVNQKLLLATALLLLTLFFLIPERGWLNLMVKNGCLLLASVMILPSALEKTLVFAGSRLSKFKLNFILVDASSQVSRRFLPLAAFYLALTSSIAAALMIHSFQSSFNSYLTQLLSADLFVRVPPDQEAKLVTWLEQRSDVIDKVLFQSTTAKYQLDTISVYRLSAQRQLDTMLLKAGRIRDINSTQKNCYINEQFAYKHQVQLQQQLSIHQFNKPFSCIVQGVYFDFGNQSLAIKIPSLEPITQIGAWHNTGYGIFISSKVNAFKQVLITQQGLVEQQIYPSKDIKKQAQAIFKQTFVITQAIAFVLLVVACIGLFLSATALELARKNDLHILVALGYSRLQLFIHMLGQWGLLFVGITLLSWPMAGYLAYALVTKVLPSSFGWSMPIDFNIGIFIQSSLLGGLLIIPALTLPLYKIRLRAAC